MRRYLLRPRGADHFEAIDRLRGMTEAALPRLLVILGASGIRELLRCWFDTRLRNQRLKAPFYALKSATKVPNLIDFARFSGDS